MKVAIKTSLSGKKKLKKLRFSGYFSKAKTEELDQKNFTDCKKIGMIISFSSTDFLKVAARASLKVATKLSFRRKKTLKI